MKIHHPGYAEPGWETWVGARLAIDQLPGRWPACDDRCAGLPHDQRLCLLLADLEVERASARGGDWWDYTTKVEVERDPEWVAVRPATETTPPEARLPRSTRLGAIATTDRLWDVILNPGSPVFEDLYDIIDGPFAGGQLVAVNFGPCDILKGLAGKLIVLDHPPARDPGTAAARLRDAAGALERGLPLEWSAAD